MQFGQLQLKLTFFFLSKWLCCVLCSDPLLFTCVQEVGPDLEI